MLDWLIKNKEWMFSGLGIAIITVVIALIRKLLLQVRKKKDEGSRNVVSPLYTTIGAQVNAGNIEKVAIQVPTTPVQEEIKKQSNPALITEKELGKIFDEIDSLPPFQQDDIKKHYVGLVVKYKGVLRHLYKYDDTRVGITLNLSPSEWYPRASFNIETKNYPQLKIIKNNAPMTVTGEISGFGVKEVYLTNVQIEFN